MDRDFGLFSARAKRSGCEETLSFGGERALKFDNAGVSPAQDCVYLPGLMGDAYSFTLRIWVKAQNGACHNAWSGGELLPLAESTDPAQYTPAQREHSSVLLSTTAFEGRRNVGLTIAHLQPRAFLTVQFMPSGAEAPVQFSGHRQTYDGRWHMISLSADRAGFLTLYIDDQKVDQADISAWKNLSLTSASLMVGADIKGNNGFGPGELAGLDIEYRALSAEEISNLYYQEALRLLLYEVRARGLDASPLYDRAQAQAFLQRAQVIAADASLPPRLAWQALRSAYENFLLQTKTPDLKLALVSDLHCDGENGGRAAAFRRGLQWAERLGVDAVIDGGDYSNFGKDFELDSYWHSIRALWRDKPLFVSLGNHETLERPCGELVRYHCDHLREQGMVGAGHDKFYYDGECRGYHFIVLAQYSDTYTVTGYKGMWRHAGEIKQEQLDFLRERLNRFCGQGKPVFVIIHNALRPLLDVQTAGHFGPDSVILKGDALYDELRDHPDVIVCTGHVHHGFGGGAGYWPMPGENYGVIDMTGFRGGIIGYNIGDRDPVGSRHGAYFVFVFGRTLLLRAVDFATGEWLTAYDQVVTV